MALKNQINTYADLTAYNDDQNKEYPNISYIIATDEVKWQGQDTKLIATFNVQNTESAVKLFDTINNLSKMWIDGVEQQSLVSLYTFDTTGEHEVKYQLTDDTTTGYNTFQNCPELASVTIPNTVTTIGNNAFNTCTSLASVTVRATTPPTLGTQAFDNNASGRKFYVPAASVTAYQSASGWSTYASSIEAIS